MMLNARPSPTFCPWISFYDFKATVSMHMEKIQFYTFSNQGDLKFSLFQI